MTTATIRLFKSLLRNDSVQNGLAPWDSTNERSACHRKAQNRETRYCQTPNDRVPGRWIQRSFSPAPSAQGSFLREAVDSASKTIRGICLVGGLFLVTACSQVSKINNTLEGLGFSGFKYHSENLALMDIESIERIVARDLRRAQAASAGRALKSRSGEKITFSKAQGKQFVRRSAQLIFARPEQNDSTSSVFQNVKEVSNSFGGPATLLTEITDICLILLNNRSKDTKEHLRSQNTCLNILNNMMEEIKPEIVSEKEEYRALALKIRDQRIRFSDALKSHRLLNSMKNIANPSKVASEILNSES